MLSLDTVKGRSNTAAAAVIASVTVCTQGVASDFTAERVLNGMTADERRGYIAGVAEGLAYARYRKDGDKTQGMKCIYDWLYYRDETPGEIIEAFKRFPEHTPGAVMAALVRKECGD